MKRAIVGAILIIALWPAVRAAPIAECVPNIQEYIAAMRTTLSTVGIKIRRVDAPRDQLFIEYTCADDQVNAEFALAAVLRLIQPLAGGTNSVHIRQLRNGDRLLELTVQPQQIEEIVASVIANDTQRGEVEELLQATLAACGARAPQVPPAETAPDTSIPAIIRQEGTAPVGGPELPALTAQRVSRPRAAVVVVTEGVPQQPSEIPPNEAKRLADELYQQLVADDLENISIARASDGVWVISFENRTWRSDIDAIAAVLTDTANVLPPAEVVLQIKRHDVVVSHLRVTLADYVKLQAGMLSPEALADAWEAQPGPADPTRPVEVLAQGNESFLHTDLLLRPAVEYQIGLENDPFESDYFLLTNVRSTIAPGVWANLRFPAQITSDQQITMDRALATWIGRPIDGLLATGSVGKFRDDLYGYYGEIRTDTDTHQFGLIGFLTDRESNLDPADAFGSAFGYYQYDWGRLGLKARLGYGQLLESGEEGLTLSLRRRFGESVIETRAIRTDDGAEGLTFEVSIPFGPRRATSPGPLRPRLDTTLTLDYVSNFNVQGDYLRGPHDLESFRGEISPAYLQEHGERLLRDRSRETEEAWPAAPSYEGTSGLIRIPTADVAPDGRLFTGVSYFDSQHSKVRGADTDAMPTFIGVGFLPNLELVGRLTFFYDVKAFNWDYNLDRSFNVHYRLNRQHDWFPALAVGAQDVNFGTTTSYIGQAEYIVGTWQHDQVRLHLGLGSGKLDPFFAGLEMVVPGESRLHLMADYDSDYVNTGLRWFMGEWGTASIGVLGMEDVTGSVTFHTDLP